MPSRERLNEFIAVVESGDHAGAIERYYTEDASMQENAAPPRLGRDRLVAHELTEKSGKLRRFDEVALQEWRGDRIFRERFFYDPSVPMA